MDCGQDTSFRDGFAFFESLESRLLLDGVTATSPFPVNPPPGADLVRAYDVNFDGKVDSGDLSIWQQNYDPQGGNGNSYFNGDFDLDGKVDSADLALWQQHYDPLDVSTQSLYGDYNQFALDHFGAEHEPLVYDKFGGDLEFVGTGLWVRPSVNAAVIGFETNLPARTYVAFGDASGYTRMTVPSEREFYMHVHYLQELQASTEYHYQLVAMDERGNVIFSLDGSFITQSMAGKVAIPGNPGAAPYTLATANTYYILTGDIFANADAFHLNAQNITLDLNGHTIVFDNSPTATGSVGIHVDYGARSSSRIYNGFIVQGAGNHAEVLSIDSHGGAELAGITAVYSGPQCTGIKATCADVHHNVILDVGSVITNRHSGPSGYWSWGYQEFHHNLLKRVRQNGIAAVSNSDTYRNEIHIDSWDTNSFGINYYQDTNASARENRIFGMGYLAIGIGTVSAGVANINVHSNLVHMEATAPMDRSPEYGDQSSAYCARISWGGDNLDYYDNLFIANGRDGGKARGTWFEVQPNRPGMVFRDNVVKMEYKSAGLGSAGLWSGAIVLCGSGDAATDPMIFSGNRVTSNYKNVSFADGYYGDSANTLWYDNTLVKIGSRSDYHTFEVGYYNMNCAGHQLYDTAFEGGASYNSIRWDGYSSTTRNFAVGWTLTVNTAAFANVTITDSLGATVFSGQADGTGSVSVPLTQYIQSPSGKSYRTPHNVTVELGGESDSMSVTMNATKSISLYPPGYVLGVGSFEDPLPVTAFEDADSTLATVDILAAAG